MAALIEQNYNLDLVPNGKPLVVNVSQYDVNSRRLTFNLFNGGVAYAPETGTAAYIMGSKPDQTGFIYGMTVEGTKASVDIYQQMTAVAGNIPCEIRLADQSGAVIGSANFTLAVEKAALDEDAVISETDIPVFENLAAQAAASAAEAATSAQTAAGFFPSTGTAGQFLQKTANGNQWADVDAFPSTGTDGQYLQKTGTGVQWADVDALPTGGTTGQVLTKQSAADGDAGWTNPTAANMVINLTYIQGSGYSADHTYDEIRANVDAGGSPYVVYSGWVCQLYRVTSQQIQFAYTGMTTNIFTVSISNSWMLSNTKPSAANTTYTNTTSGLSATTVQAAIDELKALIDAM